ncbi:MAG: amidase family protein, partial [Acidimicrobiia bacterium]
MVSIVDLAAAVRSGERSAVDGVEEALAAAEALQPRLNAFTSISRPGAMERAEELDRRIAAGEDVGELAGIPIGLKDLIDQ